MSGLEKILTMAASGMSAESIRLNTIASNLVNANSVGNSESTTYRAKHAVFQEVQHDIPGLSASDQPTGGVQVTDILPSTQPLKKRYEPDNPQADQSGYVYTSDVNPVEEMTNMIEASRSYQASVEMMNSTKSLIQQTINVMNSK